VTEESAVKKLIVAAVIVTSVVAVMPLIAQQEAVQKEDPPLPAGTADNLEARMAARRAAQAAESPAAPARGGLGNNAGRGFGGGGLGGGGGEFGSSRPAASAPAERNPLSEKKLAPVYEGGNPDMIAVNDTIITQIIPLRYADAIRTRNDLLPFISADADTAANPGSNCIIITDTSAKVHRVAELIMVLDRQAGARIAGGEGALPVRPVAARPVPVPAGSCYATTSAPVASVFAPGEETITNIAVTSGQEVLAGDVLFEFDSTMATAEAHVAEAKLAAARARLASLPPGAGPHNERALAAAEVAVEEASLALLQRRVEGLRLTAPFDGVVTGIDVRVGEKVRAGTLVTRIAAMKQLTANLFVPPGDAPKMKVGEALTFVSSTNQESAIVVTYVAPLVEFGTGSVQVEAKFVNGPGDLRVGMSGALKLPAQ
jgi:biotin carboxyl carrier protein